MWSKERINMYLAIAGKNVSLAGSSIYGFAMSLYILKVTGSAQSFATMLIVTTLPRVILSPFVGNLADRVSKKAMVVGSDLLSGIAMLALYVATINSDLQIMEIYIAGLVLSVLYTFLGTAFSSSTAMIVQKENVLKMNSWNQTAAAIIEVLAPMTGGAVFALVDIRLFILANGISFLLSAFTEVFIDFKMFSTLKEKPGTKNNFLSDFKDGFSYLNKKRGALVLVLFALVLNFFMGGFSVVVPYDLITQKGISSSALGFIEGCFPIGAIVMSIVVGTRNLIFTKKNFTLGIILFAVSMVTFVVPVLPGVDFGGFNPIYYAIAMASLSGIVIFVNVPFSSKMQVYIDESYRGRVFGLMSSLCEGIVPLSYLLVSLIVGKVPSWLILSGIAVILLAISVLIHYNKDIEELDDTLVTMEPQEV